ncbi:MAG TPA: hypothetical protein PKJ19_08620 [Flavobacteriales bacterium]|nr:hypothetical protein [Flavobacteriales bacterium]HNU55159.1 hypothetical protein [Flavobacteriales bacterium]
MWPVQTLTLLLCLTDEEQLFAQRAPVQPEPVRVEQVIQDKEEVEQEEGSVAYPTA